MNNLYYYVNVGTESFCAVGLQRLLVSSKFCTAMLAAIDIKNSCVHFNHLHIGIFLRVGELLLRKRHLLLVMRGLLLLGR